MPNKHLLHYKAKCEVALNLYVNAPAVRILLLCMEVIPDVPGSVEAQNYLLKRDHLQTTLKSFLKCANPEEPFLREKGGKKTRRNGKWSPLGQMREDTPNGLKGGVSTNPPHKSAPNHMK